MNNLLDNKTTMKKDIRTYFPIFANQPEPFVYLDNAATTHKPQQVIDAITHFYTHQNANVHRGIYSLAEDATDQYNQARATVAQFIDAKPQEIVFVSGATAGINCVAHSWAAHNLRKGDIIVISQLEHHANILPWYQLAAQKGIIIRTIPVLQNGQLDESSFDTIFDNRVKLVAITHTSNALGTKTPIKKVVNYARNVGAKILIDAAQAVGHEPISVTQLDADFLVFSGHKMFGPTGIGVLYIKKELHPQLKPFMVGGGMVYAVNQDKSVWQPMPQLLEAGTPPVAQAIGLAAAVNFIQEHIKFQQLIEYEAQLCSYLIENLSSFKNITILGDTEQFKKDGHIVSFIVSNWHAHDVAAHLSSFGIFVRAGHHCAQPLAQALGYESSVRVSFHAYNRFQDVDQLVFALSQLID